MSEPVWITKEQIIGRLREASYKFEDQNKTTECWRRGKDMVYINKRDAFPDKAARVILGQAGLTIAQIDAFMNYCSKTSKPSA